MTDWHARGSMKVRYPLMPARMAQVCRNLAADMRAEAEHGKGPISLRHHGAGGPSMTRAEAAASMDRQAERWEREVATGERNVIDRAAIGEL